MRFNQITPMKSIIRKAQILSLKYLSEDALINIGESVLEIIYALKYLNKGLR